MNARNGNIKSKSVLSRFTASVVNNKLFNSLMCLTSIFPHPTLLLYVFCIIKRYKHHSLLFFWVFFIALTFHSRVVWKKKQRVSGWATYKRLPFKAYLSNQWRLNFDVLILSFICRNEYVSSSFIAHDTTTCLRVIHYSFYLAVQLLFIYLFFVHFVMATRKTTTPHDGLRLTKRWQLIRFF